MASSSVANRYFAEAGGGVAAITGAPETTAVLIVLGMAGVTAGGLVWIGFDWFAVAIDAREILVTTVQSEFGLLVVIERP